MHVLLMAAQEPVILTTLIVIVVVVVVNLSVDHLIVVAWIVQGNL